MSSLPPRLPEPLGSRPVLADALLAGLVAALSIPQVATHHDLRGSVVAWLAEAVFTAPLAWRRRYPAGVFVIIWAAGTGLLLSGLLLSGRELVVADLAVLVALYTVATRCQPRIVAAAATATELGVVILVYAGHAAGRDWGLELPYLTATVAAAALLGGTIRTRHAYLHALADRAAALEQQAGQQARIAVAAERASIAREMHDIVAHSLAVMITMADAAARKGHLDPDRAVAAMTQVSSTGRQALGETRRLLGVLRAETAAVGDFVPQPGLSQLGPLLDQLRGTGLQARLAVTGQPFPLPDGAQLAAYRIAQEALTNILKHAQDATRAEVKLHYAQPAIEIEISDDGSPRSSRPGEHPARPPGHGLIGMTERAGLYNGTVTVGPRPDHGWAVTARLNLAARP